MNRTGALALIAIAAAVPPCSARADGTASRGAASSVVVEDRTIVSRGIVTDQAGRGGAIVSIPQTFSADVEPRQAPNITIYVDPMRAEANGVEQGGDSAGDDPTPPRYWRRR